jgi:hypothetical protein
VVDDRHFLAAGLEREALHLPWRTEAAGAGSAVLPIDERLRYLCRCPVEEFASTSVICVPELRLALLADDGRSSAAGRARANGCTTAAGSRPIWDALSLRDRVSSSRHLRRRRGAPAERRARLPAERIVPRMEGWALRRRRAPGALEAELDPVWTDRKGARARDPLATFAPSTRVNRMHKKAVKPAGWHAVAMPAESAHAIRARAVQRAYWHGVFGGLYLRSCGRCGPIWRRRGMLRAGGARCEFDDISTATRVSVHVATSPQS